MSMLFAASNILSFHPSSLDAVHRLALAKHYVGGALKYWCSVHYRLVLRSSNQNQVSISICCLWPIHRMCDLL